MTAVIPGGFGDALGQIFGFNYPTYGFSSNPAAADSRPPLAGRYGRRHGEQAAGLAARPDDASRESAWMSSPPSATVESSKAAVKLAQVSVDFAQKRVDAEQKKYDLGVTTIFFVLEAQNALANAQSKLVTQAATYRRNLTEPLPRYRRTAGRKRHSYTIRVSGPHPHPLRHGRQQDRRRRGGGAAGLGRQRTPRKLARRRREQRPHRSRSAAGAA